MVDDNYDFLELDDVTRTFMLDELDYDIGIHGNTYVSGALTQRGRADYAELIRQALTAHDEVWLTAQLNSDGRISSERTDAARRLAGTEYNRYYIRAICRRAESHGSTTVIPYRARDSVAKRADSIQLEDQPQAAPRVLANLRGKAIAGDPESGLGRVNSGLSARCGCVTCLEST